MMKKLSKTVGLKALIANNDDLTGNFCAYLKELCGSDPGQSFLLQQKGGADFEITNQ